MMKFTQRMRQHLAQFGEEGGRARICVDGLAKFSGAASALLGAVWGDRTTGNHVVASAATHWNVQLRPDVKSCAYPSARYSLPRDARGASA